MNLCPHCHRRLLTHTSAACNWCGQEIGDAAYQQQADAERQAFFAHQARRDAQSRADMRASHLGGFIDPLGDPVVDMMLLAGTRRDQTLAVEAARQAALAEAERERLEAAERARVAKAAEEQARREAEPTERFRHLEL